MLVMSFGSERAVGSMIGLDLGMILMETLDRDRRLPGCMYQSQDISIRFKS